MIKRILYLIRTFPEQVALFVFNSGIFLWISQKGQAISHELGIQQAWENYAPEGVRQFFGDNKEAVQAFFSHSAITWLIGSMIILLVDSLCEGSHQMGLVFAGDWHRAFPSLSVQSNGFQYLSDLKSKERSSASSVWPFLQLSICQK